MEISKRMKTITNTLYATTLYLAISCAGDTSKQSANDGRDTLSAVDEDPRLRTERANPNGADAYLQAKAALTKKMLEKQLREGAKVYNEYSDLSKEAFGTDELRAAAFELSNVLRNNGYREVEKMAFVQKVSEVFGKTLPVEDREHFVYVNLLDDCNGAPVYHRNNGIDYNGVFIVLPENFITDFYDLPEIIDYRSEHTDLAEMEREMPATSWNAKHKTEVSLEKWMDLENRTDEYNLERRRNGIRLLVVNRNRFLFNGDDSKLPWLLQNDRFFMERLVKRFGWTGHEGLLRHIVTQTRFSESNPDDFGCLFWKKDCDGNVRMHANTFKLLQKLLVPDATSEVPGLLPDIQAYLEHMMGYRGEEPQWTITEAQRIEVLANMIYFAEQYKYKKTENGLQWSAHRLMGRFRFMLSPEQEKILTDNRYFGLREFKTWWDAADYDEYYASGDYEGPWGRDNEPMAENEWRAQ